MSTRIKSVLQALAPIGFALWSGYNVTFEITGRADVAIERMLAILVIWVICALLWQIVRALHQAVGRRQNAQGKEQQTVAGGRSPVAR